MDDKLFDHSAQFGEVLTPKSGAVSTQTPFAYEVSALTKEEREVVEALIEILISARPGVHANYID